MLSSGGGSEQSSDLGSALSEYKFYLLCDFGHNNDPYVIKRVDDSIHVKRLEECLMSGL